LRIGIGLRTPHYQHIFNKKPVVDWFEIIPENFMVGGRRALANLDQILELYRVVRVYLMLADLRTSGEPLNWKSDRHGNQRNNSSMCYPPSRSRRK
jgi:hypothetical protein